MLCFLRVYADFLSKETEFQLFLLLFCVIQTYQISSRSNQYALTRYFGA